MKLTAIVSAIAVLVFSVPANAQGSVTIYGVLDEGINYVSNAQTASPNAPFGHAGAHEFVMTSGTMQFTRWGLKGSEDLGGGYRTIFTLENGFDTGTGRFQQGGDLWGRQGFFGVASPWGTVTLGRQYDTNIDVVDVMQAGIAGGGFADRPGDIDNLAGTNRVNNSIKFTSRSFRGLYVTGLYSFGGVAGSFGKDSIYSMGMSYSSGAATVAAGYLHVNNPNQSWFGNEASGSATANNISAVTGVQTNPIYGAFASARTYQVAVLAGQYVFGSLVVGANYSNISFQNLNSPASGTLALTNPLGYTGTATFNSYSIFTRYFVSPGFELNASSVFLYGGRVNGKPGARYALFNVGADYFLSKRTDVYIMGAFEKASGVDSTGQPAVASITLAGTSNVSTQGVMRVGLRIKF
ncbi:gram-negative porin family protein [Paraburkholderia xenovorans LB400]|uniref:Outer membrane porin, OmpC family n=1 Tax=Paraburkholderia xenovorans (strain LB400) TaxID=266265 RepID=Q13G65_PARXL|nr:porin [Paraburkholderia xenovorans]ABE36924.1 outer membrane porin, OmpC family [Paraburkholderia xenovorans LB400]AIP35012.1 gram-negative porin family protein [Paraburkholderia xenovorans LB400]